MKKLQVTRNMLVTLLNDPSTVLASRTIGNGRVPLDASSGLISFTPSFRNFVATKEVRGLFNKIFPNIIASNNSYYWLREITILVTKNKDVDHLNYTIQNSLYSFNFIDCVTNEDEATNCPTEFLNSLGLPGFPPHNLLLNIGSVIMLCNLNQPKSCNGTRLAVTKLMSKVIQEKLLKGMFKGEEVLISRIPMIPTNMSLLLKRIEFVSHSP